MDLITIIVPCYNNENYVAKCLESIRNQSYQNFEVIVINDGSTDNSKTVIENFIINNQCKNFRLINQNNQGVSTARNEGLRIAKGNLVCFVDADDYVDEHYLKRLYETMHDTQSDLCMCSVIHEKLNGDLISIDKLDNAVLTNFETANLKKLIWGYACNKLYKTKIIKNNNIHFERDIKFAEDELFYLTYLFNIERVAMIADPLYHYVRQKRSATKDTTNMSVQANRFDSRRIIIDLLIKNGVDQYVINKHIIACIDTCLLLLAYKFKGTKLNKNQIKVYLNYIKKNKELYLNDQNINWKSKVYLNLACSCLPLYRPIRRLQLKITKRV